MKCPRCENTVLEERERDNVTIDVCQQCRGIWLDRGELEKLIARATAEEDANLQRSSHDQKRERQHDDHGQRSEKYDPGRKRHDEGNRHYQDGRYRKKGFLESLGDLFD